MIVWDFKEGKRNYKKSVFCVCRRFVFLEVFGVIVSFGFFL